MPSETAPRIYILINAWTLWGHPSPQTEWSLNEKLAAIAKAGFDAVSLPATTPGLKDALIQNGLRFAGAFPATDPADFPRLISEALAIGDGPINCQLGKHSTPVEDGVAWTIQLMAEAERQNAQVHLELHRDTCTETPEKAQAIIEGVTRATGKPPRINFDFSHPAVVKHLPPADYIPRLLTNIPLFQSSSLWHLRPFNGHHCQVPVTDGKGQFSPEYESVRPFFRHALQLWHDGAKAGDVLWIVPELGPVPGYGLSCLPPIWEDAVILGHDIRTMWAEITNKVQHISA